MILEKVKAILSEQFTVNESEISLETNLVKDFNIDSLDLADLIVTLEDEFNIEIADDAMESIKTVGDVVEYLETRANESN